ncbi:rRNA methyltransferase, partial [Nocardia puris]|nr:rRNA methyltransferase [Nocardia puris]
MTRRVSTRNASAQVWQAYLTNRTKRHRDRRFLVQGVRPITQALAAG